MDYDNTPPQYKQEYVTNYDDAMEGRDLYKEYSQASKKIGQASLELAVEEPIYNFGTLLGALDSEEGFGLDLKNRIEHNNIAIKKNLIYDAGSGLQALRYLPEIAMAYYTPLSLYYRAAAIGRTAVATDGMALPLAFAYGSGSSALGQYGRHGEVDPTTAIAMGLFPHLAVRHTGKLYKNHPMYNPNSGLIEHHIENGYRNVRGTYRNMKNDIANMYTAAKGAAIPSVAAAAALSMPSDGEASVFDFAFKGTGKVFKEFKSNMGIKPIGKSETTAVINNAKAEFSSVDTSGLVIEKQLITDYDEFSRIAVSQLGEDLLSTMEREATKSLDVFKTEADLSIEHIIGKSHRELKQEPREIEADFHHRMNNMFGEDHALRDALGKTFRTGADFEDLRVLVNPEQNARAKAFANHELGKLDANQLAKVNKYIEEVASLTHKPDAVVTIAKNTKTLLKQMHIKNQMLEESINHLVKSKSFEMISKPEQAIVSKAMNERGFELKPVFNLRNSIQAKTNKLINEGKLAQEDEMFGYVKPTYNTQYNTAVLTPEEFAQLQKVDGMQKGINKALGVDGGKIIKSEKLGNGNYKVLYKDDNKAFYQGAIPIQPIKVRGVLETPKGTVFAKEFDTKFNANGNINGAKIQDVELNIAEKGTGEQLASQEIVSYKHYKERLDKLRRLGVQFEDASVVKTFTRPMTRESQKNLLGMSDDIADVGGLTIKSVQENLAKESFYSNIKLKGHTVIDKDNFGELIASNGEQSRHIFLNFKDSTMFHEPELMQYMANNYIKISDPEMVTKSGARYVQKKYAHELLGFHKTFMSQDKFSVTRFMEDMHESMVDIFRGSVMIKNPVALVNNTVSMAFTNMAYMYLEHGAFAHEAFTGLRTSLASYKEFKALRSELMDAKALGLDSSAVRAKLEDNIAYQLYKRGGLQSLLDDGLVSRDLARTVGSRGFLRRSVDEVLMTEGSTSGKFVRAMHDQSDISNRINMFGMLIKQGKTLDEAADIVSEVSVNYTRLLSPSLMFGRNKGIVPFATWYSRMVPTMVNLIARNPERFIQLQAAYLIIQNGLGTDSERGDDYIAGIRVESWNVFNALAPSNAFDPINNPLGLSDGLIPQTLQIGSNVTEDPVKLLGITTD